MLWFFMLPYRDMNCDLKRVKYERIESREENDNHLVLRSLFIEGHHKFVWWWNAMTWQNKNQIWISLNHTKDEWDSDFCFISWSYISYRITLEIHDFVFMIWYRWMDSIFSILLFHYTFIRYASYKMQIKLFFQELFAKLIFMVFSLFVIIQYHWQCYKFYHWNKSSRIYILVVDIQITCRNLKTPSMARLI